MWSIAIPLLLMPLSGLVAALVPTTIPQTPSGRFSLPVAPRTGGKRNFDRDLAAAYRKWGKKRPPKQGLDGAPIGQGRVNVDPLGNDDIYIADIFVGTPPQKLRVALDTGSADLWIQSSDTEYSVNTKGPHAPQYRPNASETAHLIDGATWSVHYLDGTTAKGIVYRDTVVLGGLKVEKAVVESALTVAPRFEEEVALSGLVGLAKTLGSNIEPEQPSFLSMLKKRLERPVFTVDYRKNATGRFDFGYINESLATEGLVWLDSDPKSPHWDVEISLTSWDGRNASWFYQPFMATIDTGTTLMFIPDDLASRYWEAIPGMKQRRYDGRYLFPCEGGDALPDFWFKLPKSDRVLHIPGPYLNYGESEDEPGFCWGGMQSAQDLDVTVLGDVMLKALFVAFDLEKNRIGFANKHLKGFDY
ncbi:Podosporapepsin [Escovopsis weberi]|uniref:Podosporapepsin n=1 Tax=Escovopsis weberi TaxID=150374 RepID=A0A0M8N8L4_ESCWE|nr:Podosporapepsin [Escovopsis weberi]